MNVNTEQRFGRKIFLNVLFLEENFANFIDETGFQILNALHEYPVANTHFYLCCIFVVYDFENRKLSQIYFGLFLIINDLNASLNCSTSFPPNCNIIVVYGERSIEEMCLFIDLTVPPLMVLVFIFTSCFNVLAWIPFVIELPKKVSE